MSLHPARQRRRREEEGRFTLENALQRAHDKMVRRHDHVFGENKAQTPEDAVNAWNMVKEEEKSAKRAGEASDQSMGVPGSKSGDLRGL